MAFVLELACDTPQPYLYNSVVSTVRKHGVAAEIRQEAAHIVCRFDQNHAQLSACLQALGDTLPASYHLSASRHFEDEGTPKTLPQLRQPFALGLGLCPECHRELFDPDSRRYYYPFTSCNHCGGQYSFFESYPFERDNTAFSLVDPCSECENERQTPGRWEQHHLISCHACGIPVHLQAAGSKQTAADAAQYKTLFAQAASAIAAGKSVLIKTTMGYRLFRRTAAGREGDVLLLTHAEVLMEHLMLTGRERNALLGIERPVLHVTVQSQLLRDLVGPSVDVKYPDEGFTTLLAAQLYALQVPYCSYTPADADTSADLVMDFDLEVTAQTDLKLCVTKEDYLIASGERVSFPSYAQPATQTLSVANALAGIPEEGKMLFDLPEHFDSVTVRKAVVLEGNSETYWHSNQHRVPAGEAACMSVIAEHGLFGKKCVGVHFEDEPSFVYYNGKQMIHVVPPVGFDSEGLLERMGTLREGSDRLVRHLETQLPAAYHALITLESRQQTTLFDAIAAVLELGGSGFDAVDREALRFLGQGGLQIDTHIKDNRFDHAALLSSLISYRLAGVQTSLIAYSLFESFGDYISDLLTQIKSKTKAEEIILCGGAFAQQSLLGRMQRNLRGDAFRLNRAYPLSRENAVVGCAYL